MVIGTAYCHCAFHWIPAGKGILRLESVGVREILRGTSCGEGTSIRGNTGGTTPAVCHHIVLIRGALIQPVERIGFGDLIQSCETGIAHLPVIKIPRRLSVAGGPIQDGSSTIDIGCQTVRSNTSRCFRHHYIIDKPVPACGVGVVAEGDTRTSRRLGEVFGLLLVGGGGPIIITVGANCHKSGGVCRVGQIAHIKSAAIAVV